MINRVLLIDKVAGPTSHDVVQSLRRLLGLRRIGHVGTLDPFATGLLVCCAGSATRLVPYLADGDKEYEGTVRLGEATDTLDVTGKVEERRSVPDGWEERLAAATAALSGARDQVPPMTSAVRVAGKRLYEFARAGIEIERRPRPVRIERFTARPSGPAEVAIEVRCSKGTYIRVLAAELGRELGTCAVLATLRRTRIGELALDRATRSDALAELGAERLLAESSISPFGPRPGSPTASRRRGMTLSGWSGASGPASECGWWMGR